MTIVRCGVHHIPLNIARSVECEFIEVDPCPECQRDGYMEGHEDGRGIGKIEAINAIEKAYQEDNK